MQSRPEFSSQCLAQYPDSSYHCDVIPQKLSLANFMCYRQAELNFAGIHVACLAGPNGAGKSALLDAITWALWGKARARRDDELIHLGDDEMSVELTFDLGEQTYRVLRQRKAGKRGSSLLDFQVSDDGKWRSIAESVIRDTQAKIEHVLRLDYDTFVNSAFLRQGHADEFTVKTPAERKRVLGDILGLDRWAEYEERAKARLRDIESEVRAVDLRLEEIEAELARRPGYEAELEAAKKAVEELSAVLEQAQAAYQQIETARTELRHAEAQIVELGERVAQAERELASLAKERASREGRLAEYEELSSRAKEIKAGYAAYQQAVEQERALGAKLQHSVELNERRMRLEAQLADARHAVETEREVIARRIPGLETRLPDEALVAEYEQVQARLTHLQQLSESREAARDDLVHIAEEQVALRVRNEALRAEMDALKEKIAQLEQAGAECPLCTQPLTEDHRVQLLSQFQAEGRDMGDMFRENQAMAKTLTEQAQALERQIDESGALLGELPALQRQEATLAERVEQGLRVKEDLESDRAELATLEKRLAGRDYGREVQSEMAQVLAEAEVLGYDAAAYEAARQAVADGQPFAEQKVRLDAAQTGKKDEQAALKRLEESEKRLRKQIEDDQARRGETEKTAEELQARLKDAQAVEAELQRVRGEEAAARQRLGAAQQSLEACKGLERQRDDKRKRRDTLAEEQSIYDELRTAFGVKGVPAMIIEAAVPEIEAEANRLLARMTGGRMHVRFDTQRETQAGEVREALEIKIADELGTREYSLYSGGEAFRVDFAIRIALSRLLARRAGAQLQTLVIDEGFGTQDAQGRERLVEAINAIQDDFARVLVITHIDELKDAFPTRIEVTKTAEGSVVEVV
ncbi:MAG: SMC family ATPase [Anaerolineae bacterium]|nr:SMC family ATPase [Anaerolineae bacterium]